MNKNTDRSVSGSTQASGACSLGSNPSGPTGMKYQIEYRKSHGKGRGVFALKDFRRGELIEKAPVLLLSPKESLVCEKTMLDNYLYEWRTTKDAAIVLGYGSLYNHSNSPNATYSMLYKEKAVVYKAFMPIHKEEEIFIDYSWKPEDTANIEWFHGKKK